MVRTIGSILLVLMGIICEQRVVQADDHQYEFEGIRIPKATSDEPLRESVSTDAARDYLEQGSVAWSGQRKCISCHTNGTYMAIRPSLTPTLGAPPADTREFFVSALARFCDEPVEKLRESTKPAQVIYLAAGLAEWDRHVSQSLSPETQQALELMFTIQEESGTWGTLTCWPPFESDAYHEATVAMMAASTAPGWLERIRSNPEKKDVQERVDRLIHFLKTQAPPHDYGRVLLLWAASRQPELVTDETRQDLLRMIRSHQKSDGSWSIRSFATPEAWGAGNRAEKLRSEPDFGAPPGDGHMTGLAIIVLREAGISADDEGLQKGVRWLEKNQRESGRWWTRSLNTDSWHFITYSGTAYPMLALQMCRMNPGIAVSQTPDDRNNVKSR